MWSLCTLVLVKGKLAMVWFSFTVHRLRIPHVPRLCSPGVPDNANSTGLCCARKHLTKGGYKYIVYNIDTR